MYLFIDDKKKTLPQFFPKEWQRKRKFSFGYTAFRALYDEQLTNRLRNATRSITISQKNAVIIIYYGRLEYPPKFEVSAFPDKPFSGSVANILSEEGVIAISFAFGEIGEENLEIKSNILLALTSYSLGFTLTDKKIDSNCFPIDLKLSGEYIITNSVNINYLDREANECALTREDLDHLRSVLDSFDFKDKNLPLSLNWYLKAVDQKNSTDSFLSYYIALEALGTEFGSHKIGPMKAIVQEMYNLSTKEASDHPFTSRIYYLRGYIIHNALEILIPPFVLEYLRLFYFDLIDYKLGITPNKQRLLKNFNKLPDLIAFLNSYKIKE